MKLKSLRNIKRKFKGFKSILSALFFIVKVLLIIILSLLIPEILFNPENWLNISNYKSALVIESLILLLPFVIYFSIVGFKFFKWKEVKDDSNGSIWRKILSWIVISALVIAYLYFGVIRLLSASTQDLVFLQTKDCYTYYETGRRSNRYYYIVANDHLYDANSDSFNKLTKNFDVKKDTHYNCVDDNLVIIPVLNTVIDIKD